MKSMNIFKKDKVNVDDYLKALKVKWNYNFYNSVEEQGEYIIATEIVDKYKKQNKYNLFRVLNEKYRPYIKYGKISQISGKIFTVFFILFFVQLIIFFTNIDLFVYSYSVITTIFLLSRYIHMHYRDKYEKEREIYLKEMQKPNWRRKQIMNRLLK